MTASARSDPRRVLGRSPERLTLEERFALAGKYAALEIYTPEATPLRRIEAIGDTVEDCIRELEQRKLNPLAFEYVRLTPPY